MLRSQDVNEVNSYLLTHFIKNIEQKLSTKKTSLNDKIEKHEITEILNEALANHNQWNEKVMETVVERYKYLTQCSQLDFKLIEEVLATVGQKSLITVKVIIAGLILQFVSLYYITYHVGGWDLGEPIGYLLAVALEIAGRNGLTKRWFIS